MSAHTTASQYPSESPDHQAREEIQMRTDEEALDIRAPAVYAAMSAVQQALAKSGVGKNGTNQQQHFRYRAWDDVQQALAPILAENKLLIIPRITSREESALQSRSGGTIFRVVLSGDIEFVSGVDGSRYAYPAKGEAMDSGDKATSKAITMLVKYAVLHGLCIPLAGVPDADATTPEETVPAKITEKQAADLDALIQEVGADHKGFVDWLKIDALTNLPASEYERAVKALERKRKAVKEAA